MALNSSTSACTAGSSLCASIGLVTGVTATVRSPARIASSPATGSGRQLSLRVGGRWVSSATTGSSAGEAVGVERRRKDTSVPSAPARCCGRRLARRHSSLYAKLSSVRVVRVTPIAHSNALGVAEDHAYEGDERAAQRDLDERLAQRDL